MKKWVVGVLAVLMTINLAACGKEKEASGDESWTKIEDAKEITIGLDDTFVPLGFKNDQGEIVGFDVDIATAIFKDYGITPKFQPIDWSMKENELDNGTIDLIWNGYSVTKAREKKVRFTIPYAENDHIIMTRKDSGITKREEMKDKILGTQESSSSYESFLKNPEKLKDLVKDEDAVQYASFNEAFMDLENGRLDGILVSVIYAEYYLKQNDKLDDFNLFNPGFKGDSLAVGARKGDKALVDKINQGMKKLEEDGRYAEITEKWFGKAMELPAE
ncbi:glutamine ABC transporter substrate-binding protein [Enterococcus florum]|uniref:Glutamine ABC transporter substrate-binding protein n=1 Tax=Enterococcus florum TaxID=2480627 RepID=A0A4P5P7S0_9ENTE|nr:amino acid ABC transporter substrate-binding protein [Enterococcus florum]GCF93546.1 glutamine ABC transporter substrate-binding protein [Enterococcus florum]